MEVSWGPYFSLLYHSQKKEQRTFLRADLVAAFPPQRQKEKLYRWSLFFVFGWLLASNFNDFESTTISRAKRTKVFASVEAVFECLCFLAYISEYAELKGEDICCLLDPLFRGFSIFAKYWTVCTFLIMFRTGELKGNGWNEIGACRPPRRRMEGINNQVKSQFLSFERQNSTVENYSRDYLKASKHKCYLQDEKLHRYQHQGALLRLQS